MSVVRPRQRSHADRVQATEYAIAQYQNSHNVLQLTCRLVKRLKLQTIRPELLRRRQLFDLFRRTWTSGMEDGLSQVCDSLRVVNWIKLSLLLVIAPRAQGTPAAIRVLGYCNDDDITVTAAIVASPSRLTLPLPNCNGGLPCMLGINLHSAAELCIQIRAATRLICRSLELHAAPRGVWLNGAMKRAPGSRNYFNAEFEFCYRQKITFSERVELAAALLAVNAAEPWIIAFAPLLNFSTRVPEKFQLNTFERDINECPV
ncbi:hypothetical protein J6590_030416 [Homalodisca vitripennis]|nr:hypothetical protein J6590_030416 [Homalodisca vitripennis]